MTMVREGQRYWKHGDHAHVWIVDAVVRDDGQRQPFAVLVSEDGKEVQDVDLSHLEDRNQFTPTSEDPTAGRPRP